MKTVKLERLAYLEEGTFGELTSDCGFHCYTVERPWLNNKPWESCVPEASYECQPFDGNRFKGVVELTNVPDRSHILIHAAHWPKELHGCIGLGNGWEITKTVPMVYNSKATCREFFAKVGKEFILTITSRSAVLWE